MSLAAVPRAWRPRGADFALAVGAALLVAALTIALGLLPKPKMVAGAAAAAAGLFAAFLSGNPRLLCLWCLMATMTLDLSKGFGPVVAKLGGETAFRVDVSDLFWAALLAYQLRDAARGRGAIRIPKVTILWTLVILMGAVQLLWGAWPLPAAHEAARMLKVMLLFIVVANELTRPGRFLQCAAAIAAAVIFQSAVGILQYFTHAQFGLGALGEPARQTIQELMSTSQYGERLFRAGGLMIHPNIFGIFLAATLPLMIGVFLVKLHYGYRLLFFCGIVLGAPALIASFSRSSWASFLAAATLMAALSLANPELRRRAKLPGLAAAAGLVVVLAVYAGPVARRILEARAGALSSRAEFEGDAMRLIAEKPILGWGLNSYALAVPPFTRYRAWGAGRNYQQWTPVVHNTYLLWWAETGLVGLALHVLVVLSILGTGAGNLRVRNQLLYAMNAAGMCAMVAFLVDGIHSPSLRNGPGCRAFWVLAGIVLAVRYWRLRNETTSRLQQKLTAPGTRPEERAAEVAP